METQQMEWSASVIKVSKQVGPDRPISAAGMAKVVFNLHSEYAGNTAASLQLRETSLTRKASEWMEDVQSLFDGGRIQSFSKSDKPPTLHGRLLVIGLCLLEPRLREQLESAGVFDALAEELGEPLPDILTERGRALLETPPTEPSDSVPNWPDDPLHKPDEDLLGRAAFARYLAKRIAAIPPKTGAYALHVYGPWGAGKSTLLNFLHQELLQTQEWLVVEFNAWRNQHIQPPWWCLMEQVFIQTRKRLSLRERFLEYWWRFNTGRMQYWIGLILLAWLLALIVFPLLHNYAADSNPLRTFADGAGNISKLLALLGTIWGGVLAASRSLLLGSAQAAQRYTELTYDPTNEIRRRFAGLINRLSPQRVAILIDDLDRCQSRYVVDLLEGIQTLFRDAPVVCVVAADRHWLNACYEEVYEKLEPRVHQPGKPLGTLFLEKAFRFSTPMPGIPERLKESYWRHLLQLPPSQAHPDMAGALQTAKKEVSQAQSEADIRHLVDGSRGRPFPEQRALREEAVVKLASPEIQNRLEHTLKRYASFLEPNPRAMKLLVNTYSANRALAILLEVDIDLHQLALWTILCSRWPQLADYMAEHADMLDQIGQGGAGFPDKLKALCGDRDVIQVLKGDPAGPPLSADTLNQCAYMR